MMATKIFAGPAGQECFPGGIEAPEEPYLY